MQTTMTFQKNNASAKKKKKLFLRFEWYVCAVSEWVGSISCTFYTSIYLPDELSKNITVLTVHRDTDIMLI